MKVLSTRGGKVATFSVREAIENGLATDRGLYVPSEFARVRLEDFQAGETVAETAARMLRPFFEEDSVLGPALPEICRKTFSFPIPRVKVSGRPQDSILELFHGPTSAFKDVGARFLANVISTLAKGSPRTVIVATSGDTGGAVAGAFFGLPDVEVAILFPKGMVSPRQEKQLCAWGGNIRAFAVEGTFDDCQRIVKEALLDRTCGKNWLSANSINLGRILPQMVYYAVASLEAWREKGNKAPFPGFIIPSGNLGNALAALWAKQMGFPIGPVVLALNENRVVADFLATGVFTPAGTKATLANAMDVGNPSNLERIRALFPEHSRLTAELRAEVVTDEEIRNEIKGSEKKWGQALCPHTATAAVVRSRIHDGGIREWILVSTAHAAKFESIVEPLIGHSVEVPAPLAAILERPSAVTTITPTFTALQKELILAGREK